MNETNKSGGARRNILDSINDTPRTDLTDETLELWPRMIRERATDPAWSGYYGEHDRNDILDLLDVIATLKARMAALEAEHAALMTRAMKDADRVGNAYSEFTNQQTARIEVLEAEKSAIIESADNLFDEQTARIEALEKTIRKVIYGVRGIDLPCEKWVTAELSHILPGFDQIGGSDSSNQKANDPR